MQLLENYVINKRESLKNNGIRFHTIGDLSIFNDSLKKEIEQTKIQTSKGKNLDLVVAVNYGGRNEIKRAIKKIMSDCEEKKISKNEISEKMISKYMDTAKWDDPELLIRTGGEQRLSNFLMWQIAYSEIYITDTLWPDFTPNLLYDAIKNYQSRKRRLGT